MTAPAFAVNPYRFTNDPEAMRRFLEALGLVPRFASGIGYVMLEAGSGWVSVHPADLSATHAEHGETQLSLLALAGDGEDAAEALADLGLDAKLWEEQYGGQAGVVGPAGEGIWVDGKLKDTVGAGEPDPAITVVAVRYSADFAADRAFFATLGFAEMDGASEWWTSLTAPGGGTVGLHKPSDGADLTSRPSEHNPIGAIALASLGFATSHPLEELAARLTEAGYEASVVEDAAARKIHVVDPDGKTIEIHPAG